MLPRESVSFPQTLQTLVRREAAPDRDTGFGNIVEMCRSESIETLNKSLCKALWSGGPSGDAGGPCQEVTAPGAEKLPTDTRPVTEQSRC